MDTHERKRLLSEFEPEVRSNLNVLLQALEKDDGRARAGLNFVARMLIPEVPDQRRVGDVQQMPVGGSITTFRCPGCDCELNVSKK